MSALRGTTRWRTIVFLLAVPALLWLGRRQAGSSTPWLSFREHVRATEQFGNLKLYPSSKQRRVTLVANFNGKNDAPYLNMLFVSAAHNRKAVDLLFINIDEGTGCLDLSAFTDPSSPGYAPNIRHLCLTPEQNDALQGQFICDGWNAGYSYEKSCGEKQKAAIAHHLQRIRKEARGDILITFKPWRGFVYKDFIQTEWVGWFETDAMIGSFEQLMPWDIMENFDIITAHGTERSPNSLFLPGQLTFFKSSEKMFRMAFRYKALSSVENLKLLVPGDHDNGLEEGRYSHMYTNLLPEADMLRLEDVFGAEPGHGDRRVILADGHLLDATRSATREDVQFWYNKVNDPEARGFRAQPQASLTKYGYTQPMSVSRKSTWFCNGVAWNPANACAEWKPFYAGRQFSYRLGGSWYIRREPATNFKSEWGLATLQPRMFVHILVMKREVRNFTMPNLQQSGYLAERSKSRTFPDDGLDVPGRKLAVFEMSRDWWGVWTMEAQSSTPPRGFDVAVKYRDPFYTEGDHYWAYHHHDTNDEVEIPVQQPGAKYPVNGDQPIEVVPPYTR